MFRTVLFVLVGVFASLGSAQDHSTDNALNLFSSSHSFKGEPRFTAESHLELLPNKEVPKLSVHRESGQLTIQAGKTLPAVHVYRGERGRPQGDFDLFAVEAGRVKTFAAAKRACDMLPPLGEWRLANVVHVMAFFSDVLPAHPMFDKPQFKGRFFWATSLDEKEDRKNRDDFVAANDGGGEAIQVLSFKRFIQWIHASRDNAKSEAEKKYYDQLLHQVNEGIPTICIRGQEPQSK
ncbi:MAG: hypothetical protein EBR01_02315 [Proteobacteria bacterium]|nr:hypothetical protein [Pseudomonadota bacterium]